MRAQSLLAQRVTIDASRKPMSEVLKAMGRQGGFYFSYNSNIVKGDSLITVHARGMTVRQVLDQLLGSYQRGAALLAFCREKLQAVEDQIKVLDAGSLKPWTAE